MTELPLARKLDRLTELPLERELNRLTYELPLAKKLNRLTYELPLWEVRQMDRAPTSKEVRQMTEFPLAMKLPD